MEYWIQDSNITNDHTPWNIETKPLTTMLMTKLYPEKPLMYCIRVASFAYFFMRTEVSVTMHWLQSLGGHTLGCNSVGTPIGMNCYYGVPTLKYVYLSWWHWQKQSWNKFQQMVTMFVSEELKVKTFSREKGKKTVPEFFHTYICMYYIQPLLSKENW